VVLWGTMVGKKVVMAVTGIVLVGFVIAHMIGNLKIFLGAEAIDAYAVFLRTMGEPMFPSGALLWVARIVLLTCVALHDDQPMGFYMVSTNMSEWELEHLWILPKFMRRGVGRALLMHAAEVVSERGGTELHIDADPNAEAFYSACGAVRVGSVAAPIAEDFERTLPRLVLALRSRPLSGQ